MNAIKKRFATLLAALAVLLGLGLTGASSAQASPYPDYARNIVENSGLSNANMLVCGTGGACYSVVPGYRIVETPTWNPTQVAVGAYQSILYRYVKDDYEGPWGGLQGGTTGAWLNVENLQNFFGQGGLVQVIFNDPR